MNQPHKSITNPISIAILCSLAVISIYILTPRIFAGHESRLIDAAFRLRGIGEVSDNIVMVDCDDKSMEQIGRWPWKRSVHGDMIRLLKEGGARVIAYDILFDTPFDKDDDEILIASIKDAGNVVLPAAVEFNGNEDEHSLKELKSFSIPSPWKDYNRLFLASRAIPPFPPLMSLSLGMGHIYANRDQDGVIRETPIITLIGDNLLPAFGLTAALRYMGIPNEDISIEKDALHLGKTLKIPIDKSGMMLINYAGRWTDTFKHIPFADIYKNKDNTDDLKRLFGGKLVIVSNSATGFDIKSTSIEKDMPGGGIHANIINTILMRDFLKKADGVYGSAIILFTSILSALLILNSLRLKKILFILAGMFFYVILSFALLTSTGYILPVTPVLLSSAITTLVISCLHVKNERQIRDELILKIGVINSAIKEKEELLLILQGELNTEREEHSIEKNKGREGGKALLELKERISTLEQEKEQLARDRERLKERLTDLNVTRTDTVVDNDYKNLAEECAAEGIFTKDIKMLNIFKRLKKAASVDSSILILGEPGTGKELFAKAVHNLSSRKNGKLVTVNLPALSEGVIESELFGHVKGAFTGASSDRKGRFEQADKGTIFLDEIGELKFDLQSKLLRVLQTGEIDPVGGEKVKVVDVRIISATNRDLQREAEKGNFRPDLFSRLNVITVTLPPLCERKEDIAFLANIFLSHFNKKYNKEVTGISERAMEALKNHTWKPGNVRDLKNTIERAIINTEGSIIGIDDLGLIYTNPKDLKPEADAIDVSGDRDFLILLNKNNFEIGKTAAEMGISRGTVASRFKGICLQYLSENGFDKKAASKKIACSDKHLLLVEKRLDEYYSNICEMITGFDNSGAAFNECIKKLKNLPMKYHTYVEKIIKRYLEEKAV